MKLNNVDVGKAGAFAQEIKADGLKAIKAKKVEGSWNFSEGRPQFSAVLAHASGTTTIEADAPPFLGGEGQKPDPVQYCLFGLAACFAQTFASVAAEKGVKLSKLSVSAGNTVNLSAALGIGNEPPTELVKITVTASGAESSKLQAIEALAKERCPGVHCLTNPIRLQTELKVE